ncbi:MAG: T9SS type A sorting domain-containing protein [Prevotellaceae bacterium]|jgi:hypothetical protein|nr:T9SS type A sorting domain-containing protein [Prevotellaceae bacterium]
MFIRFKRNQWVNVLLLFVFATKMQAQELLTGLSENPYCTETVRTKNAARLSVISLELPFVDDFSKNGLSVPDPKLWTNSRSVYVNNCYAINPPTKGVATFDALDGMGRIYKNASSSVFSADTLTSSAINLNYSVRDSVCLSFYFQPQGYGDLPEKDDSLSLEFYSPLTDQWDCVWSASVLSKTKIEMRNWLSNSSSNDSNNSEIVFLRVSNNRKLKNISTIENDSIATVFFRVNLKIENSDYLKDGFRFRFINHASISVNPAFPGRSTNVDHWHLDYVYLDKNRSSVNSDIQDIALTGLPKKVTVEYSSVPASHFEAAGSSLFENPMNLELNYTNLGWGTKSVSRNFRLRTLYGNGRTVSYSPGAENISNGKTINFTYPVPQYRFSPDSEDYAAFEITSWIDIDNDPSPFRAALRQNDTSRVVYEFGDSYSYDDGTSENGYGLFGDGSSRGKVAVKFSTFKSDSLRGIYMYFNSTLNDANQTCKFTVAVWNDADGVPGEIIHRFTGAMPVFHDSLNRYVAYKFPEPVYLSRNQIFYIGWLQTGDCYMNVGFDRNTVAKDKLFYSLGQNWEHSAFDGSLMMRPIFCRAGSFPADSVVIEENDSNADATHSTDFRVYPNPSKGMIYLEENSDNTAVKSSKIEFYSISGELVKAVENVAGSVDLSSMPSGIYLMQVWGTDKRLRETKRVVIGK